MCHEIVLNLPVVRRPGTESCYVYGYRYLTEFDGNLVGPTYRRVPCLKIASGYIMVEPEPMMLHSATLIAPEVTTRECTVPAGLYAHLRRVIYGTDFTEWRCAAPLDWIRFFSTQQVSSIAWLIAPNDDLLEEVIQDYERDPESVWEFRWECLHSEQSWIKTPRQIERTKLSILDKLNVTSLGDIAERTPTTIEGDPPYTVRLKSRFFTIKA